jgi:acyl-CoA thioester hydrolase
MVLGFFPEGAPPPAPPRQPFPPAPPPPPGVFRMRRQVHWQDIDQAGHVNNAQYLAYISDCAFEVARAYGWPAQRSLDAGFAIVVRQHRIQYLAPALLDDELEIATWLFNARRASVMRAFTVTRPRDEALIAQAQVRYAWLSLQTGQPIRIPPELLTDFADNLSA